MKVVKFGGTSLANASQVKKICDIVLSDSDRRLVVVSAPGKRFKDDIKVTDLLISCAQAMLQKGNADAEKEKVVARFDEIAIGLGLDGACADEIRNDLDKRLASDASNAGRFTDALKAAGEDYSARLVASYLRASGVNARYVNPRDAGLLLSSEFGNAQILPQSYANLARSLGSLDGITIFPGFFGYTVDGDIATFPRGGSDITGSILAAAVNADVYENFTDVDSVFVANPNIISNPLPIKKLTYREMRELSYSGFSVFHEEALEPVYRKGIPVCIKNTNNPAAPGTLITPERENGNGPVAGIACENGFCSINISKYLMNREIGIGRKLLQIFEEEKLSYEHTPSGIDNISVLLKENQLTAGIEDKIVKRIKEQLNADEVSVRHGLSLVMIVGEGMRRTVGIAARATAAFVRYNINIEIINQGASEVSVMFGILHEDSVDAVKALYAEFFET